MEEFSDMEEMDGIDGDEEIIKNKVKVLSHQEEKDLKDILSNIKNEEIDIYKFNRFESKFSNLIIIADSICRDSMKHLSGNLEKIKKIEKAIPASDRWQSDPFYIIAKHRDDSINELLRNDTAKDWIICYYQEVLKKVKSVIESVTEKTNEAIRLEEMRKFMKETIDKNAEMYKEFMNNAKESQLISIKSINEREDKIFANVQAILGTMQGVIIQQQSLQNRISESDRNLKYENQKNMNRENKDELMTDLRKEFNERLNEFNEKIYQNQKIKDVSVEKKESCEKPETIEGDDGVSIENDDNDDNGDNEGMSENTNDSEVETNENIKKSEEKSENIINKEDFERVSENAEKILKSLWSGKRISHFVLEKVFSQEELSKAKSELINAKYLEKKGTTFVVSKKGRDYMYKRGV